MVEFSVVFPLPQIGNISLDFELLAVSNRGQHTFDGRRNLDIFLGPAGEAVQRGMSHVFMQFDVDGRQNGDGFTRERIGRLVFFWEKG